MKFQFEYLTLTQLGELFGVSNQQIGKWLVAIGLRNESNRPSKAAFNGQFVTRAPSRNAGYNWAWHSGKTVAALQAAGHEMVPTPPVSLVEPPVLVGPLSVRACESRFGVLNGDGDVCLLTTSQETAYLVVKVLNLANKHGIVDRMAAVTATTATASSA